MDPADLPLGVPGDQQSAATPQVGNLSGGTSLVTLKPNSRLLPHMSWQGAPIGL